MQRVSHRTQSFDGFTLDLTRGCLLRGTQEIKLRPKPFDTLKYLVANPGRLVSKAELIKAVWPDTAVTDDSLVQCLMEVRRALGDDAQTIIKTVPRRGYIFDREVTDNGAFARTTYTEETSGVQVIIEEEGTSGIPETSGLLVQEIDRSQNIRNALTVTKQSAISRRQRSIALAAVLSLCAVAALLLTIYSFKNRNAHRSFALAEVQLTRLTSTGDVYAPIISPDGKYLAYCSLESGLAGLRVRQVATGTVVQVVPAAPVQYWGISFSRDSEYIYYGIGNGGPDQKGTLYRVPALGGHPEKLLSDCGGVGVSKDGQHLAFQRVTSANIHQIIVTDKDARNEYVIPSIAKRNLDIRSGDWSPDGKSMALAVRAQSPDGPSWQVSEFPIDGGNEKVIVPPRKTQIIMIVWLADNSGLIMSAIDPETQVAQLSFVSYPGGEERRITNDLNNYKEISVTADGRMIVAQRRESLSQLWIAPNDNPHQGRVLLTFAGLAYSNLSWTPDNHIVFDMEENGFDDIWKISADGSGRERLTYQQGQNREPSTTADGRHIVFISNRTGSSQIWRMGIDGNDPKQLVSSTGSIGEPQSAPESESVLYLSSVNGQGGLFKVPLDGGKASEVIDKNIEFWAISPDGLRLAYSYRDQDASRTRVAVVPFGGGSPLERFDLEPCYLMRWTRDGSGLVYIAPDDNIWVQPIAGGPAKQLTHFQRDLDLISFAWSADGKQLAYARRSNAYDAVAFQIK